MNRYRTLMSVLLGLMLLLQGFAVSAAPLGGLADVSRAGIGGHAEMPCHMATADAAGKQVPSCCNANCPDMTTCALGHIAASVLGSVVLPAAMRETAGFTPIRVITRTITSPLRPPITLHG